MPLNEADRAEIRDMIRESDRTALMPLAGPVQCRADYPHDAKLRYQRGPNVYVCECGKRYEKDGKGGLRDVAA